MKLILLVICVFAFTNAIRVSSKWHNGLKHRKHIVTPIRNNRYQNQLYPNKFNKFNVLPHKGNLSKHKLRRKLVNKNKPVQFKNVYRNPPPQFAVSSNSMNLWTPIIPFGINSNLAYIVPKPNLSIDLTQFPKEQIVQSKSEYVTNTQSPLYKNYRDDKTSEIEDESEEALIEPIPENRNVPEDVVQNDHEKPLNIPTRPIYPGEKIWAKPGQKHKPFIREHIFTNTKETQEERPEGYEILRKGEKLLAEKDISRNQPSNENHEKNRESSKDEEEEESRNEDNSDEFVPMTLYTQVRRSDEEEHFPSDAEDSEGGRLKEVIKDSRIHTVYTEEGYEDGAYDHAGHEKEVEDSEGYSEFNKEEEHEKGNPKSNGNLPLKDGDQVNEGSSKIFKTAEFPEIDPSNFRKNKSKKHPLKNVNKFTKTKAMKTMKLKENTDGSQMQITSEVKIMMSPFNGSTTEIIEVLPKVVEYFDVGSSKHEGNSSLNRNSSDEVTSSLKMLRREKRFTNDLPKIDVKEDFIKGIEQSNIPEYKNEVQENKYPYYNVRYLNQNSPLRYSENLGNIPIKTEGRMVFYEQTNGIQCPEVGDDIEAIPTHVQEVEEAINNGEKLDAGSDSGKSPRLGKLGQRIDCLKRKFFGDDPLDSPFFKEKAVGQVTPLFKIFEKKTAGFQSHHNKPERTLRPSNDEKQSGNIYHSKFSIQKVPDNINERAESSINEKSLNVADTSGRIISDSEYTVPKMDPLTPEDFVVVKSEPHQEKSPDVEIIDVYNFSSIDKITTDTPLDNQVASPSHSSDIIPKHIYDQIELLPSQSADSPVASSKVGNERKAKLVEEASNQSYQAAELRMNYNPNRFFHPSMKVRRKNWHKRPQQSFDINTYLANQYAKNGNDIQNIYNMKSKFYNNEQIVPLEQLNVFSDVLNNIKNGTNDPLKAGIHPYSVQSHIGDFHSHSAKVKIPPKKIHVKTSDLMKYLNNRNEFHMKTTTSTTTISPTQKPKRGVIKYKTTTEKEYYDDEYIDVNNDQIFGKKTILGKKTTSTISDEEEHIDSEVSESHTTDTINNQSPYSSTEILGLVPPSKWQYRTIFQPVEELISDSTISGSETLNTYYVVGMLPPSTKHNIYDFQKRVTGKGTSIFRNVKLRRNKRSANRKSYFEVVGNQKLDITEVSTAANDDDYVPHRPKNWHWDEKLKKIIYNKPKFEEYDDDDPEVIEKEDEDTIPKNIQQTSTRKIFTTSTSIDGPSYVDFIKILKSNKNYVSIPDPTTTKDGIKTEKTTISTVTSGPTKQPEFLNILSELRQSDSYVKIKDKNNTKTTTTTTEVPPEEIEEQIQDSEPEMTNIQNSPGKGAVDIGHNLKIFDVNDFLPRMKTYSPRTEIDYSKYKTIRRTPPRRSTESPEDNISENVETIVTTLSDQEIITPTNGGKLEVIELSRKYSTTEETTDAPSTTIKIQRTRGRRPSTTTTPVSVSSTTISKDKVVFVTASKPKRVYPRRKYPHIRPRTTTEGQGEEFDPNKSTRNVRRRHNNDESNSGETKIISLETLIKMEQLNHTVNNNSSQKIDTSSSSTNDFKGLHSSQNLSVDDILKNINQLKEVNIEEIVPDYSDDSNSSQDEVATEVNESTKDYFDDDTKIELNEDNTTHRKLFISKNKEQGMYQYVSVR